MRISTLASCMCSPRERPQARLPTADGAPGSARAMVPTRSPMPKRGAGEVVAGRLRRGAGAAAVGGAGDAAAWSTPSSRRPPRWRRQAGLTPLMLAIVPATGRRRADRERADGGGEQGDVDRRGRPLLCYHAVRGRPHGRCSLLLTQSTTSTLPTRTTARR